VLGDDHVPVEPVERFLAYLASVERSPNTVKAYAHDLKDWFTFLAGRGLDWQSVTLEDVAGYVAWLRLPPAARDGLVQVLPTVQHHCGEASVNRKLAALTSFCEFHARHGVALGGLLVTMAPAGRGWSSATSFKPFLHHITKNDPQRRRTIKLSTSSPRPRVLSAVEAQQILNACGHLRDRLLFALLLDTGVRIGEALGLRHEDLDIAGRQVAVVSRVNDNRARAKGGRSRSIPCGVPRRPLCPRPRSSGAGPRHLPGDRVRQVADRERVVLEPPEAMARPGAARARRVPHRPRATGERAP